jgi:hypothetical protein
MTKHRARVWAQAVIRAAKTDGTDPYRVVLEIHKTAWQSAAEAQLSMDKRRVCDDCGSRLTLVTEKPE